MKTIIKRKVILYSILFFLSVSLISGCRSQRGAIPCPRLSTKEIIIQVQKMVINTCLNK
jgi:hypothetical protein